MHEYDLDYGINWCNQFIVHPGQNEWIQRKTIRKMC